MRIPDGVWKAAQAEAAREGRTMTDVVTELLQRWIAARRRDEPSTPD
jgi:hypothetical protein